MVSWLSPHSKPQLHLQLPPDENVALENKNWLEEEEKGQEQMRVKEDEDEDAVDELGQDG